MLCLALAQVVLATNIAETSITIDDIVYVVDCGKQKQTSYNEQDQIGMLKEEWISQASARQRRGRAGRVQAGVCYHLFTSVRGYTLDEYQRPEIVRQRLENTILELKMLKVGDVYTFLGTLLTPPSTTVLDHGYQTLHRLGALEGPESAITALGMHMAKLATDPHTAKMIVMAAIFGCVEPITSVAANLSYKDAFVRPLGKEAEVDRIKVKFSQTWRSDHLMMANVMQEWRDSGKDTGFCRANFLNSHTLHQLENMKQQFCDSLYQMRFLPERQPQAPANNVNTRYQHLNLLRAIILSGLYPNVATLK